MVFLFALCYRKCESSQVFVKDNLTHCIDTCKSETMCGEVVVPEKHLDVSFNYIIHLRSIPQRAILVRLSAILILFVTDNCEDLFSFIRFIIFWEVSLCNIVVFHWNIMFPQNRKFNEKKRLLLLLVARLEIISSENYSLKDSSVQRDFIALYHKRLIEPNMFILQACRVCNEAGLNCRVEPNSEPGEGIDGADFVFYVSAMSTERCKKGLTVAYAAHCQQEAALDRYDHVYTCQAYSAEHIQ